MYQYEFFLNKCFVNTHMISQKVVHESGPRISISSNGDSLINTIGMETDDVVQLIAHPSRSWNVRHTSRSIQFASNDIIKHATSVANFETTGFDTSDSGGSNDINALFFGLFD